MGKKKALVVVAHKILIACYHILKHKVAYKELGSDYLIKDKKDQLAKHYVKKLDKLGYQVQVEGLLAKVGWCYQASWK